jgi:acyl-CoA thioesterase-1
MSETKAGRGRLGKWVARVLAAAGLLLVLGLIGFRVIMGRVCTDAKPSGAAAGSAPFFAQLPAVLNMAHRGASRDAPEHSLRAYELALEQGAQVLELDLRATRDGVLVLAHDATLERTLGLPQRWSELTWEEAQRLSGERAPLRLQDVLARFPDTHLNLELKDESSEAARSLAQLLRSQQAERRVLVASARDDVLREFRAASQGAVATSAAQREALLFHACYLIGKSCPVPYVALQLPAIGWLGLTSAGFIEHAHRQGLQVHYWTIDDPERQRQLLLAGADGIMTNQPAVLARTIAALPPRAAASRPLAPPPANAPAIVFLGDSLTAGLGLPESQALPARIQQRLSSAGLRYRTINGGRSGDTSAGGLARLDWYFRDSVDLRALVIGLGSNDAMRGLSLSALGDNLTQIIRKTRERKPDALIFLWALETFPNLGPDYAREYAAIFPAVAERERVQLIPFPLADVAGNPRLNQEDGIHPTAEGTELVADRIWAALQPALAARTAP